MLTASSQRVLWAVSGSWPSAFAAHEGYEWHSGLSSQMCQVKGKMILAPGNEWSWTGGVPRLKGLNCCSDQDYLMRIWWTGGCFEERQGKEFPLAMELPLYTIGFLDGSHRHINLLSE